MKDSNSKEPGPKAVRKQLRKILESDLFSQGPRQCRFLTYIVEATISGEMEGLNQFSIGIDVFDRDETFDPSIDAIVRVEAGRLRSKLAEYYSELGCKDPILIQFPRGGYRVSAEYRQYDDTADKPSESKQFLSQKVGAMVILALLCIGGLLTTFFILIDRKDNEDPSAHSNEARRSDIPSIAILPFDNMSNDPEQSYFCEGITEDIITDLSIASGLRVIARNSTFVYKGQSVSIKRVGEDLGVSYILEGSVRKAGDQIRINAQLIDVATESHIWAERFDRTLTDIFATQDEVSQLIVNSLEVELSDREEKRLHHIGTRSIEAYDHYLRAREHFYQFSESGVIRAIELLSQAIEFDSNYAEAYAWKSRAILYSFVTGLSGASASTVDQSVALARHAVELDPELPMAYANLGWALRWRRDFVEATSVIAKAIELNPNFAEAYLWDSLIQSSLGNGDEAISSVNKGMILDPHYSVTYILALGRAHFELGQYETALYHYNRGIERNPNFIPNHTHKMLVLEMLGSNEELERSRTELERIAPDYKQGASYKFFR